LTGIKHLKVDDRGKLETKKISIYDSLMGRLLEIYLINGMEKKI
jgi:hypothetical protein